MKKSYKILDYFELIRTYRLYNTLVSISIHLFLTLVFNISQQYVLKNLFFYFFIIGYLLYGGIYTLNGIADLSEDKLVPYKAKRPIPSGRITINQAYIIAILHITPAFILSYFFGLKYFLISSIFFIINIAYTYILKRINRILSSMIVTLTWILRILSPFIILDIHYKGLVYLLLSSYILGCAMHLMLQRRQKKQDIHMYTVLISFFIYSSLIISVTSAVFLKDIVQIVPFFIINLFFLIRDREFLKSMYVEPKSFDKQLERGDK